MSIEDINYMKENSIKQAYTFIIDSSERNRDMYPNPNNYVVNFSTPFKNIIGMEIIDASIPRAMYTIDVDNNEFYYYIGDDTGDEIIETGMQINNDANLLLKNWNYTSNISSSSNITSTSNISSSLSSYTTFNTSNSSNIFNSFIIYNTSNIYITSNIFNNSNILSNSSNISTLKIMNTSNIYATTNTINSSNIINNSNIYITSNIYDTSNIYNISRSSNISYLELSGDRYAVLNNSINLYNIYNNAHTIGGYVKGLTLNLCFNPLISDYNIKYNIIDFSYSHTYSNDTDIYFRNISIDVEKDVDDTYILTFAIGTRREALYGIGITNYINIYWSILNTSWSIGVFDVNNSLIVYEEFANCEKLYNVFFTKKYIGKKHSSVSGWNDNVLLFKDFKIYNVPMMTYNSMLSYINLATPPISSLPIWFKMDEVVNNMIINDGNSPTIGYKEIFKTVYISPGDYTFKTFITKYNELIITDEMEIMFKETSTPPELKNLIDIYSKSPLLIDMKRSTVSENLGFDLYPTQNNEDRYISKPYANTDSVLAKMFYSRLNATYDRLTSVDNKYIITSPGIVYFIGNKYIIMRCPEIEEHLYRSLSYSKNALGLAKFRVDSVGINSEKLTITKIPVREFHPIGKLSRMSLRFETNKGKLYDFKGINHNIIFAIFYYEPTQKNTPKISILNPEYKMNYLDYLYKQEEIEGDSDDDNDDNEDFSRDNIDDYKTKEQLYNERGVKLQQFNNYFQNNNQAVIMENEDDGEYDDDDDEDATDKNNEDYNDSEYKS